MSKPKFSKSISTPIPTNGAAKNPRAKKRKENSTARTRTCFCETSIPTNTPHRTSAIAKNPRIKMSNSLPNTLSNPKNHKHKTTMKTQVHANNSFVKLKAYSKIYSSANHLKLSTDPKHQNYNENHSSLTLYTLLSNICCPSLVNQ
jgi:hypothetical protein